MPIERPKDEALFEYDPYGASAIDILDFLYSFDLLLL